MSFNEDFCEKCGKRAKHYISSASGKPTLKLCHKCHIEHEEYIRQKENEFLGKEFFKKENFEKDDFFMNIFNLFSKKGIGHIEQGDKVKCLKCGKEIIIGEETCIFNDNGEYIVCPHCKKGYDIQVYHLKGEKL